MTKHVTSRTTAAKSGATRMWQRVTGRAGWSVLASAVMAVSLTGAAVAQAGRSSGTELPDNSAKTTTPIKHVVVLFDENISFDHYFATYPYAANNDGTPFHPAPGTPTGIDTELNAGLIPGSQLPAHNPNGSLPTGSVLYTSPNPNAYQPQRLAQSQAVTCDQNHSYGPEQSAANGGAMNKFVESTNSTCTTTGTYSPPGLVMDYYDGNTVTALWNYAQNYAMSDDNWNSVYGPSTPGALNLVSGNTYSGSTTINTDIDPNGDSFGNQAAATTPNMFGANIGDLLNGKGVSWGWFQGGFADKSATTANAAGALLTDYSPHHNPFEYYASTANPNHTPPSSGAEIGHDGAANHEYDLSAFNAALSGTAIDGGLPSLPAVSFLKAPEAQDGHAGYSDPLSEQKFLTTEINAIEQSRDWSSTAIVVTYDDSDGWYDHVAPIITNASSGASGDAAICTTAASAGVQMLGGYTGRCGPSQRLPLLVISPYAKKNYVSHDLTDQASVLKFIEQNWDTGGIDSISSVKGSFDASAGSLDDMFDWAHPQPNEVLLDAAEYSAGTTLNPTYGAVLAKPADPVAPVAAPVIDLASHTLTIPAGSTLPAESDFLTEVGATIDHGTLSADLAGVDPNNVGQYPVTVTGSVTSLAGDVPAANPQVVTVQVAPAISVAHSTVTFTAGADRSPSYVRSLAGATIAGGTLDLPDLSGVDFNVPGSYPVQITGSGSGVAAIPASITVVVKGEPTPIAPPVISVAKTALVYPVGAEPTADQIATAAGVGIDVGSLDPVSLSGVDFTAAGTYSVAVTGSNGDQQATPVTLTIAVVAAPRISVGSFGPSIVAGTHLSSAQVLAEAFASISAGTLGNVDLSGVHFDTPGTYPVSITGQDRGVAATPVIIHIEVKAAVVKPAVSATGLHVAPTRTTAGRKVSLTIVVSAQGTTPGGKAAIYDGSKLVKTVAVVKGKATLSLTGFSVGTHKLHASYLGAPNVAGSTSKTVALVVTKVPSKTTLKVADRSLHGKQRPRLTITVTASGVSPGGTVRIYDGRKLVRTAKLARGKVAVTLGALKFGKHTLKATYTGSATVAASTSRTVWVTSAR